ncbi:follistatin-related protein 3-like [Physella acuta]|uniref:follistatin-related protein 3-like n=1 Tax=Physella acuta TaxID=109671 RepID=UPI0027DB841B|nr:follistatin-related protein 3-like [Physella acuta]
MQLHACYFIPYRASTTMKALISIVVMLSLSGCCLCQGYDYDSNGCPTYCLTLPSPVCGSDWRTYTNICHLKASRCRGRDPNLRISFYSTCSKRCDYMARGVCPPSDCPGKVLCGSDGNTYVDLCTLELANCKLTFQTRITVKHCGRCKPGGN